MVRLAVTRNALLWPTAASRFGRDTLPVGILALVVSAVCAQAAQETVFKASVNLVQVDAVVTDGRGRQVTGLGAGDFEVLQDGKPQKISACSYIRVAPPTPATLVRQAGPPVFAPPSGLRPGQALRSYALVVDDLALSFESIFRVRLALRKFVDEQMQSGDLVAILRTSAGMGALQQFTSDKRQLNAAIERIRWTAFSRVGVDAFAPLTFAPSTLEAKALELRQRVFTSGTLAGVGFALEGLRQVPGRKALVLFSEQIQMFSDQVPGQRLAVGLDRLADLANRAGVLVYTVDPRGLPTLQPTAADNVGGGGGALLVGRRRRDYLSSQSGLEYLASLTGGLFLHDKNDIGQMIREALDDLQGYYLIGYTPEASTFDALTGRRLFHRISVRVKQPGLRVRSRSGFYAGGDEKGPSQPLTQDGQLLAALLSPFGGGDIHVRMTALFRTNAKLVSQVIVLAHVDARDLTFTPVADGESEAVLDVFMMTFGDNGQPEARSGTKMRLKFSKGTQAVLEQGLTFRQHYAVKKPGGYQVRFALRDVASGKTGSANEFVDVPDVRNNRLAISGILLQDSRGPASENTPKSRSAALREFRPADAITYAYQVLNPRLAENRGPNVESQVIVYRDGQRIYSSAPSVATTELRENPKAWFGGGILQLGRSMAPGDYVLQVVVTDKLASKKYNTAKQWTDFRVEP